MKKNKNLTKVLYAFVVLSLMYTCYTLFDTYSSISAYYGDAITTTDKLLYVISNVFIPLMMTVVLYALAVMNETFGKLLPQDEVKVVVTEEKQAVVEEKVVVEDEVKEEVAVEKEEEIVA